MWIGMAALQHGDLPPVTAPFLAPISFPGVQKNNTQSLDPVPKLNIELWLILLLNLRGSHTSLKIFAYLYHIHQFSTAIISVLYTWPSILSFTFGVNTLSWITILYANKLHLDYLSLNMCPLLIRLLIYLLNQCPRLPLYIFATNCAFYLGLVCRGILATYSLMLATIVWVYPTNHGVTRKNYDVIRMIILTGILKEFT
jgi:hypothetical protein